MHIHGPSIHVQAASFHNASLQSRATLQAQRAAETRKRLLRKSELLRDGSDPDADLLIGHWLDAQDHSGPEPRPDEF